MYCLKVELSARNARHVADKLLAVDAAAVDVSPVSETPTSRCLLLVYAYETDLPKVEETLRGLLTSGLTGERADVIQTLVLEPVAADWETRWADALVPVELVPGLVLVPEGTAYEGEVGKRAMVFEKGLVFGFGEHPTTRMACEWLAQKVADKRVLDIGSGTGVLSFVAAHCGARSVLGIDLDAASVRAAQRNAERNGWAQVCEFSSSPLEEVSGEFDVVVANVDAASLIRMATRIGSLTCGERATGLALTGVLREQVPELQKAYAAVGIALTPACAREDWVLLQR